MDTSWAANCGQGQGRGVSVAASEWLAGKLSGWQRLDAPLPAICSHLSPAPPDETPGAPGGRGWDWHTTYTHTPSGQDIPTLLRCDSSRPRPTAGPALRWDDWPKLAHYRNPSRKGRRLGETGGPFVQPPWSVETNRMLSPGWITYSSSPSSSQSASLIKTRIPGRRWPSSTKRSLRVSFIVWRHK